METGDCKVSTFFLLACRLVSYMGFTVDIDLKPWLYTMGTLEGRMEIHDKDEEASDFGNIVKKSHPLGVLHPASVKDIAKLIKWVQRPSSPYYGLSISARGHGHSINGQAMAPSGIVINMKEFRKDIIRVDRLKSRVEVSGGELWIDVLHATLKHGLAPRSWTDYLYLTVGGTLSNAGISGQAFRHGPQITNVLNMEVVTGSGDVLTCSMDYNTDLFYAVLGGLGQFGIITKATIQLEPAPQKVKWIRVLYSSFDDFTRDQEYLISQEDKFSFDYVEGFVIVNNEGLLSNWRSSFFSPQNPVKVSSLNTKGQVLYCIEMTKNYYEKDNQEELNDTIEALLEPLKFIPASIFTTDTTYIEFLDRVHASEVKLKSKGLWDVPHPWLNLFIPKSKISHFNQGVFNGILRNISSGPILLYPMNRNKWNNKMSAVIPDEEIFYLVAFLRSAMPLEGESVEVLSEQNQRVLEFCEENGIGAKQYLPHYKSQHEWKIHFGNKWNEFLQRKSKYDPNAVLSPGQCIFPACSPIIESTYKTISYQSLTHLCN